MNIHELRRRRADQARAAVAGAIGSLNYLRRGLAPLMRAYFTRKKQLRKLLAQYEALIEDVTDKGIAAAETDRGWTLIDALTEAIEDERKELGAVFVDLTEQSKLLRKKKPKPTRVQRADARAERAQARAAAKAAAKAGKL